MKVTASLEMFAYDKKQRTLSSPSHNFPGGFPSELVIESHHTGKSITFVQDIEAAINEEFWDGEQMKYKPVGDCQNVSSLVIYNC